MAAVRERQRRLEDAVERARRVDELVDVPRLLGELELVEAGSEPRRRQRRAVELHLHLLARSAGPPKFAPRHWCITAVGYCTRASQKRRAALGLRGEIHTFALIASERHVFMMPPQMMRASQKRAYAELVRKVTRSPRNAPASECVTAGIAPDRQPWWRSAHSPPAAATSDAPKKSERGL